MADKSLLDLVGGLSQGDLIVLAAGLGGLGMWGYWYYRKKETGKAFRIDSDSKVIQLGAIISVIVGLVAGSATGIISQSTGLDTPSAAALAFAGAAFGPWFLRRLLNTSYEWAVRIANSKWFRLDLGLSQKALPDPLQVGQHLTPQDYQVMSATQVNQHQQTALDWAEKRTLLTGQLTSWYNSKKITKEELMTAYRLIPQAPDFQALQQDTALLAQQREQMTLTEKTKLVAVILSLQNSLKDHAAVIHEQQALLERHEQRYDPTSRVIRDVSFGVAGFIVRSLIEILGRVI